MITWLTAETPFPPVERALLEPNGLLAAGGDLTATRLLAAYRRGIFPWYSAGQPILWWSPDPRMVLHVEEFRIARSLRKRIRRRQFEIRTDTAFIEVIEACATSPRRGQFGTWITPQMIQAYVDLFRLGYSHSVEAWLHGQLVGGLYGLVLGRVFFGESMFTRQTDASKVAFASLIAVLRNIGIRLVDCQQETDHLASLGAKPISRDQFASELDALIDSLHPIAWPRGALTELP